MEENICCKNPLILPEEKFNGFDCITQSEAFRNVCLDKDVLGAAWKDLSSKHVTINNINYRFIAYKQYVCWTYGYLGKKKRKPLPNCAMKQI